MHGAWSSKHLYPYSLRYQASTTDSCIYYGGPSLARQFCQIQRLGGEHQGAPPTVSPVVLAAPITTPLVADAWAAALQSHPALGWVERLVTGMKEGFHIGLVREHCCQSSPGNTPSATEREEVISDFLSSQCRAGYM